MSDETSPREQAPRRVVDLVGLKALAHPLRIQIFDTLSTYGPATASGLADRLAESSGATSYHLRQLERHGFVREVQGRGTARERWWERVPGSVDLGGPETRETEAGRMANRLVAREMMTSRERHLRNYIDHAEELESPWIDVGGMSLVNLRLTADQFVEANKQLEELINDFSAKWRGQDVPGARAVQFQINAIPIIDAHDTPEEES